MIVHGSLLGLNQKGGLCPLFSLLKFCCIPRRDPIAEQADKMSTASPIDEKLDKSADHIDDVEYQKDVRHTEESVSSRTNHTDGDDVNSAQQEPAFDPKETKRILRKIDVRLIPVLALLYLLAFLDRSNIANARVAGMNDELELTYGGLLLAMG